MTKKTPIKLRKQDKSLVDKYSKLMNRCFWRKREVKKKVRFDDSFDMVAFMAKKKALNPTKPKVFIEDGDTYSPTKRKIYT